MKLKRFFIKNISTTIVIFPLVIIIFYGVFTNILLKYKHSKYEKLELSRYEQSLKKKHRDFFKEKVKYIDSFITFLSLYEDKKLSFQLTSKILLFVESLKKYDNGFIFIFKEDGTVLKHPCAKKLVELVRNDKNILKELINASKKNLFLNYRGTDCIDNKLVNKIAFVHHIKNTDLYVVISKNEKDIAQSIQHKKHILEKKLNDELEDVMRLLIIACLISIIFSLFLSKIINILIKKYELEIKNNQKVMFYQSRLAQAGEILSMISHQWRQPLSKIASIASNLKFKIMMNENIKLEYFDKKCTEIENYTEFLSETIDDFREFYQPNKKREHIYIIPLIEKALSFLEGEIKKKNIHIIKHYTKDEKLYIYSNEFIQVIINIVQNAIDFSSKGAKIIIKTAIKNKEYIISIQDEAGGIKEEFINKIFEANFSTKNNKESKNLGLGLYVSKIIIEKHFQGKLEVVSYNNSSKFIIRLLRNDK